MFRRKILFTAFCFSVWIDLSAQSTLAVSGGLNQSIFYTSQSKREYYHSFQPYNSYSVNFSYKEDFSNRRRNLQLGAQIEFKQQSSWFYYEDKFLTDTFATGLRYDIQSVNLYLFPELRVGESVKFIFSGGPVFQYIYSVKAKGRQIQLFTGQKNIETEIDEPQTDRILGFVFGAKITLGVEIPLHKGLYFTFSNAYYAGFNSMQGTIRPQMKYFNCLDINLMTGLLYRIEHKNWFQVKEIR